MKLEYKEWDANINLGYIGSFIMMKLYILVMMVIIIIGIKDGWMDLENVDHMSYVKVLLYISFAEMFMVVYPLLNNIVVWVVRKTGEKRR